MRETVPFIAVIKLIGNRYERDVSHRILATIDRIETGSTHGGTEGSCVTNLQNVQCNAEIGNNRRTYRDG